MAEVFIFLSGYVCGKSYGRRLELFGWGTCQRKALGRCFQLYIAHILTLLLFLAVLGVSNALSRYLPNAAGFAEFHSLRDKPLEFLFDIVLLKSLPGNFEILPLYMVFLSVLPTVLLLRRRIGAWAVVSISATVYALVQTFPDRIVLAEPWGRTWGFNPFAWQLVFFFGVVFDDVTQRRSRNGSRSNSLLFCVAVVLLEASFLHNVLWADFDLPWVGKPNFDLLRVLSLACCLIVAKAVLPAKQSPIWKFPVWSPLIVCGRNSLITYCVGCVLSTIATLSLVTAARSTPFQVVLNFSGWLLCVVAALAGSHGKAVMAARSAHRTIPPEPSGANGANPEQSYGCPDSHALRDESKNNPPPSAPFRP